MWTQNSKKIEISCMFTIASKPSKLHNFCHSFTIFFTKKWFEAIVKINFLRNAILRTYFYPISAWMEGYKSLISKISTFWFYLIYIYPANIRPAGYPVPFLWSILLAVYMYFTLPEAMEIWPMGIVFDVDNILFGIYSKQYIVILEITCTNSGTWRTPFL